MQFPTDQLRPRAGSISAMVFRNDVAGIDEKLFWSVEVGFEPIDFNVEVYGDHVQPSLAADTFTLPIRDWRDVENQIVEGDQDTIEASFYIFEHDLASWTRVRFGKRAGINFAVELEVNVELVGLDPEWNGPGPSVQPVNISIQTTLPYSGIYIREDVLDIGSRIVEEANRIASRYADLRSYNDVRIDDGWFIFDPLDS